MSTASTIREMLEREPFGPFLVRLSSGDNLVVEDPHLVAMMKSELFVAARNSDRRTFVPYLHIAAVRTLNGDRSRQRTRKRRP